MIKYEKKRQFWRLRIKKNGKYNCYSFHTREGAEKAEILFKQTGVSPTRIKACIICGDKFLTKRYRLYCGVQCSEKNCYARELIRNPNKYKDFRERHKENINNGHEIRRAKARVIAQTLNITAKEATKLLPAFNLLTKETENA